MQIALWSISLTNSLNIQSWNKCLYLRKEFTFTPCSYKQLQFMIKKFVFNVFEVVKQIWRKKIIVALANERVILSFEGKNLSSQVTSTRIILNII